MTQNECTSNIKYPGSSFYTPGLAHPDSGNTPAMHAITAAQATPPPLPRCPDYHTIAGVGLTSGGDGRGRMNASACCAECDKLGRDCAAWTWHANTSSCTTCGPDASCISPHTAGCDDVVAGSKTPLPPGPYPPHSGGGGGGGNGFGPCPILNGSTGAVMEQYDLLSYVWQ